MYQLRSTIYPVRGTRSQGTAPGTGTVLVVQVAFERTEGNTEGRLFSILNNLAPRLGTNQETLSENDM